MNPSEHGYEQAKPGTCDGCGNHPMMRWKKYRGINQTNLCAKCIERTHAGPGGPFPSPLKHPECGAYRPGEVGRCMLTVGHGGVHHDENAVEWRDENPPRASGENTGGLASQATQCGAVHKRWGRCDQVITRHQLGWHSSGRGTWQPGCADESLSVGPVGGERVIARAGGVQPQETCTNPKAHGCGLPVTVKPAEAACGVCGHEVHSHCKGYAGEDMRWCYQCGSIWQKKGWMAPHNEGVRVMKLKDRVGELERDIGIVREQERRASARVAELVKASASGLRGWSEGDMRQLVAERDTWRLRAEQAEAEIGQIVAHGESRHVHLNRAKRRRRG